MRNTDKAWQRFGQIDPYFAVLTHQRFRSAGKEGETRREFFESGADHVERLFATIKEDLDPEFAPRRALDFGCGVGRVAIPLARRVTQVVAIDVSDSMLDEAKKNCEEAGVRNVTLLKSDDSLENLSGDFDFLHSFIVFQHIPTRRGEMILRAMLRRLSDNGIGSLHFVYASSVPGWRRLARKLRATFPLVNNLANLVKGPSFKYPYMEMNNYNVNRLLLHLQEQGCHRVHLRFCDHGPYKGIVLLFKKETLPLS
jgi:2-polyprenyl-3-methyl-5-hydroxy-6-metoxy-1,4-benzoquinol methylase